MIIKKGQTKKLELVCFKKDDPTKEEKVPNGVDVHWFVSQPLIVEIVRNGDKLDVKGLKEGRCKITVSASKKVKTDTESFAAMIEVEVQDDSKPPKFKTGILSIAIKEK